MVSLLLHNINNSSKVSLSSRVDHLHLNNNNNSSKHSLLKEVSFKEVLHHLLNNNSFKDNPRDSFKEDHLHLSKLSSKVNLLNNNSFKVKLLKEDNSRDNLKVVNLSSRDSAE